MSLPDIYDTFKGKSIFFTGVTGFVGKVYLFKLLKEFPDLDTVYCLCRPKKGVSMQDRFTKEVLSSPCFTPLIKEIGEEEWKRRSGKCKAVAGDITHHRLGLSDSDYTELTDKVNIIVHLAATVDFQEKLNVSCHMNVLGSVRVMTLAHKCQRLESYIHTSTCYVNWNRDSADVPVQEKLYPLPFDPEAMLKYILSLNDQQVPGVTKELLEKYRYPNTYTFSKGITEHILMKQRGNLPFVIVRPAIVGASWREPYNGWVDALTAAGGLFLVTGLGLMHEVQGSMDMKTDVVPCDHVVNLLLKVSHRTMIYHKPSSCGKVIDGPASPELVVNATAAGAKGGNYLSAPPTAGGVPRSPMATNGTEDSDPGALQSNFARVYQSSTSSTMNPLRWSIIHSSLIPYWNEVKHPKALGPSYIIFHNTRAGFLFNFYAKRVVPVKMAQLANSIPGIHSDKRAKLLSRYEKAMNRVQDLTNQFTPFISKTWIFDCSNGNDLLEDCLSPKARQAFTTDVFDINWYHYGVAYSWGLIYFIMKDKSVKPPPMPESGTSQVLKAYL